MVKGSEKMNRCLKSGFMLIFLMLAACQPISDSVIENNAKSSAEQSTDLSIQEDQGQNKSIVATTVAATEVADALELELVGIPTSYKTLPERYEGVQEIGNPMSPDMEQIRKLQPDEVWSVTTLSDDLEEPFEQGQIKGRFLDFQSVEGMKREIAKLGSEFNREREAGVLIDSFEEAVENHAKWTEGLDQPSVLILMGVPGSYLVATEESYIGDLVRLAGGTNVIESEEGVEYLASNTEHLHQAKPDVILRAAHGMPEEVIEMFDQEFEENDIWKHFKAVQEGRVYDLEELLFGTTGSIAVPEALDDLVLMLYPALEDENE